MSARNRAADTAWCRCGRARWISSRKAWGVPSRASTDIAPHASAVSAARSAASSARTHPAPWSPVAWVPLMSASPSLGRSSTGTSPAPARASCMRRSCPSTSALPSPSRLRATCARGARSPLAPTDPNIGTLGWIPRRSISRSRSTSSTRHPECPQARALTRRSMIARAAGARRYPKRGCGSDCAAARAGPPARPPHPPGARSRWSSRTRAGQSRSSVR